MEQIDEIQTKANYCLSCKNAKCKEGCPISTNIPEFIAMIKEKKYKEAFYILQENNLMSEICSTICPVEKQCMGSCIRGIKGKPVEINYLEKYINTWANRNNIEYDIKVENKCNKKVAIIGSGPAGLECAVELRKQGADVTVFEKEEKIGGILEYGIPDFRLSKDILSKLYIKLQKLGIKFKFNTQFGKDVTIESLKKQGYNIFLGIGAQKQSTYKLTEEPTGSIYKSDEFLKTYNTESIIKNLGTTVVIGGGNVAFDSARAAIKMGAKDVYIIYRRSKDLMPAREIELEEAITDGVKIIWQTKVTKAKVENEKVKEIECIKTKIENEKAINIEGSEFTMKADSIIFAIGAKANEKFFEEMGIHTKNGLICVDENYMTNVEGVYAGGDLVETKSSVARAIATGKKTAEAIINNK